MLEFHEHDGLTFIRFQRQLKVCGDDNQDLSVPRNTAQVIWAYGIDDPIDGVPMKHQSANRGQVGIKFNAVFQPLTDAQKKANEKEAENVVCPFCFFFIVFFWVFFFSFFCRSPTICVG